MEGVVFMSNNRISNGRTLVIGFMLFATFFGAGNLIFPASMGQHAGVNVWYAVLGFIFTGVGLLFLGVLAIGYSGCRDLEELAGRVSPKYGMIFALVCYLALGPCFAGPRTGTVSYEIGAKPFFTNGGDFITMAIYLCLFFALTFWLASSPSKIIDRVGKILSPALMIVIAILIIKAVATPLGQFQIADSAYDTSTKAIFQGFLDGYNTMDALAAFFNAIFLVGAIKESGAMTKGDVSKELGRVGIIGIGLLAIVYIFIAYLGATSVSSIGIQETGASVLLLSAKILLGTAGAYVLSAIVVLACLTTSVALVTCPALYFNELFKERVPYKLWLAVFTIASFLVSLFGLKTIIVLAIPVLVLMYPLIMALLLLTFTHNFFNGRQCVYVWTTALTFIPALVSGMQVAHISLGPIERLFNMYVPFNSLGMGWVCFTLGGYLIGVIWANLNPTSSGSSLKGA